MSSLNEKYWRSLSEYECTGRRPAPCDAAGSPAQEDGLSRRRWLQLMGASLALAGAGGCRWEKTELLPMEKRPSGRTPGKLERFATAMDFGGSALGLVVTCVDGRPIKIEGNPKHPYSLGATNAYAQAAILELYDPDRSKNIVERTPGGDQVRMWDEFAAFAKAHFAKLRKAGGEGLAILSEASSSPTLGTMRKKMLEAFPKAKWHEFEPLETKESADGRAQYSLDKAEVIVSLGADLFGTDPAAVRYAHDFGKSRDASPGKMSRLYVVESCYTITGAMADHRLALREQQIAAFLGQLVAELKATKPPAAKTDARPVEQFLRALANDIRAHHGKCVFVAGPRQPALVRQTIAALNATFGKPDETFRTFHSPNQSPEYGPRVDTIQSLASSITAGGVRTLLVLGGNPAYNAPADLRFAESLARVETTIHLGLYRNETARQCTWHLPQAHFLESWGDAQAEDGTYSVVQPMIEPLHGGRSAIGVLALLLDVNRRPDDLVRDQLRKWVTAEKLESQWREALHDGIAEHTGNPPRPPTQASLPGARSSTVDWRWDGRSLEIIFRPDAKLYDGRFANNGWLQEMPDPLTKLTWGNAALMSVATAQKLGVAHEDIVKLKFKGREVETPVYVMPGQADGTVALSLGYGRTAAGQVGGSLADGVESVGFDAYKLRTSDAMWFGAGLTVEPTGKKYRFATTHDHYWIDRVGFEARAERVPELVREATVAEYQKNPQFAKGVSSVSPLPAGEGTVSLWQEPEYKGRRWGMTIDLSKCVGCGACTVACQAENNVPVVGRDRVLRGREMHWLRIDRYFQGEPAQAKVVFQPVACHHCELAPCEEVCPVGATVHSQEGLNDMAYNRCIGVRYCGNNCPYKVRRFNFFNYHKDLDDPANEVLKMVYNPQVTVRSRGVMEKCTYCVQRIQAAKIEAKNHRQATIPDGQIKTACQQACPTAAIIFGDLNDTKSQVARQHGSPRAYQMLAELNIKPRTSYLARIRNPNPALKDV
jgi:molybdopterin-containing oxidoreductase family iron-sulfur binding subunit